LAVELWQISEIQQALKKADDNDFASDVDIEVVVKKYAG